MRFWKTTRKACGPTQVQVPPGRRVYAIGDVHGRLDLLLDLLRAVEYDHHARGGGDADIVMLGDLIDRGPDSAGIIEYLMNARPDFAKFHFIQGNHEEAMLNALAEGADPREVGWLDYGGWQTLKSYGVPDDVLEIRGWLLSDELRRLVPRDHLRFISEFKDKVAIGDYLFVHAGIRPGVALDRQNPRDLRWIREPFLNDDSDHGVMVIHGHTIEPEPVFRPNRIGIDTGAYRSGTLTALALEGTKRWILSTTGYPATGCSDRPMAQAGVLEGRPAQ